MPMRSIWIMTLKVSSPIALSSWIFLGHSFQESSLCLTEIGTVKPDFEDEGELFLFLVLVGVLTFDEFMMAYILLQRGGENPSNRWQYAMNVMPTGAFSRPGLLNSAEALSLLQYMNRFYQFPSFDPSMQHNALWNQAAPQLDPTGYISQAEFLRLLSSQPQLQSHIW